MLEKIKDKIDYWKSGEQLKEEEYVEKLNSLIEINIEYIKFCLSNDNSKDSVIIENLQKKLEILKERFVTFKKS